MARTEARTVGSPHLAMKKRVARRYGLLGPGEIEVPCHWCGQVGTLRWIARHPAPWTLKWDSGISSREQIRCVGLQFDHVIPVTRGGPHTSENLVLACCRCNVSRGNKYAIPPHLTSRSH